MSGRLAPDPLALVKGTLDVLVLRALAWGPMHGFEITTWLEDRSAGALGVDDSALYQALHRLEARALVAAGYREIVLTGVDVTSYGLDLPGRPTLGQLVRRLLALVPDLPRLRLSSLDPVEIDGDLWRLIAEEPRCRPGAPNGGLRLLGRRNCLRLWSRRRRRGGRYQGSACSTPDAKDVFQFGHFNSLYEDTLAFARSDDG